MLTSEDKKIISETIKESSLNAKDNYDYRKLELPKNHFIDLKIESKEEDLIFHYNFSNLLEASNLKKENSLTKLRFLISVSELEKLIGEYEFSLEPKNLYYGKDEQVQIKMRDIRINKDDNDFLNQYKALIGDTWQDEYSYEDYLEGGAQLLAKNKFLKKVLETNSIEEVVNTLNDKFEEIKSDRQKNKIIIDKKKYKNRKMLSTITMVLLIIAGIYVVYMHIKVLPLERAISKSNEAYIKKEYVDVIDILKDVKIKDMGKTQKFILANSYIRSESFTDEQKENIFKNVSLDSNDEILDYWIHLGRSELDDSVNIAMKLSDDELLLYAYMKQLDKLEKDTTMDGTEKSSKIKELEQNIDSLLEKFNDSEEDS